MIEREAISDTPAAIVPDDIEAIVAERGHHLGHIERHRALGVGQMFRVGRRLAAVAIAAQIGNHQGELLREARRDLMPDDVILWISVDEQQRRSGPALSRLISAPEVLMRLVVNPSNMMGLLKLSRPDG